MGAHCHLGSTITKVGSYQTVLSGLTVLRTAIAAPGLHRHEVPRLPVLLMLPAAAQISAVCFPWFGSVQVNIFRDATLLMVDFIKQIRAQVGKPSICTSLSVRLSWVPCCLHVPHDITMQLSMAIAASSRRALTSSS